MTHELKILPEYFREVWARNKTFEVRKNDRNFQVGDTLHLKEWDNQIGYTGSEILVGVTYVLEGGRFGIESGFCVMSIEVILLF